MKFSISGLHGSATRQSEIIEKLWLWEEMGYHMWSGNHLNIYLFYKLTH